jgi:hypothetical protein
MFTNNLNLMLNTTETAENVIKIGIAITPEEKREIYHFRYQTYIEEMSKQIDNVDHNNGLLYDDLDEWAFLLYAKIDSKIIATIRINLGTLADFPRTLVRFLSLDTFLGSSTKNYNHKITYVAKLMVSPSHRNSPALYLLIAKCYDFSCSNGVEFGFSACNLHLLRLYEQIGWHRYSKNFLDPGYGLLSPIVMFGGDIEHFRTIRSPLFRMARKRAIVNTQTVEWFHEKFIKHSPIINSQIVTEEELWSILCKFLNHPPTEAINILRELSEAEAKKLLHSCSSLVQCDTGDMITTQGDISYSYNILLSGKLKSLTFQHPIKEYAIPGQSFGANGLTEHNKHTEDIEAVTTVELLVLSGMAFPRFFHSHPDIAHKIVRNLSNSR